VYVNGSVESFILYVHKIYIKVTTEYVNGFVESYILYVHKIYIKVTTVHDSTDPLTYTVVTLIYILCTYCLKMATDRGRNMY
jgi:hypothetical protein